MSGRRVRALGLAAIVVAALFLAGRSDGPATPGERVQRLSEQLRCPVCDGLAVADSPSSTARAIAADVRRRVEAGESDGAIRQAYMAQYGEWILLEPPGRGFGALAWALPVTGVVLAGAGAAWTVRRRARTARPRDDHTRRVVAIPVVAAVAVTAGWGLVAQLAPRSVPVAVESAAASPEQRAARLAAIVRARPDDVAARLAYARLLLQQQDLAGAADQFDAAVAADPDNVEALAYGGWVAVLTGDVGKGVERLDRAVAADASYPDAHALRGLALMRSADEAGAVAELRRYLELAPDGPLAGEVATVVERLEG
jgi:cytochrome c-type biogenesis protein CcmH